MGNSLSESEIEELKYNIDLLNKLEFNNLDIKNKQGATGYIDFISLDEVDHNVMKGYDVFNRVFFVIKAEIENSDGSKIKTFTTFFQRYSDNKNLWHTAGNFKSLLFDTVGGATLSQIKMLIELLINGYFNLDLEKIQNLKINCYPNNEYEKNIDITKCPIKINIGYSN